MLYTSGKILDAPWKLPSPLKIEEKNIGCIILSHTNKMRVDQPESGLPVNNNPARPHQIWIVEKRTLKKDQKEEKRTLPKRLRDAKTRKLCDCICANGFGPDMEFVKNFIHPDFQAKSFTPQKSVICDSFFTN